MIDWAVSHVPVQHRVEAFTWIFVALAFGIGYATNFAARAHYITRVTHTHPSVTQLLGKPGQTIDGAQVNAQLAGLSCDIYANGSVLQTMYCHR